MKNGVKMVGIFSRHSTENHIIDRTVVVDLNSNTYRDKKGVQGLL